MTILSEIVTKSEWIIAILALYVVAWTRFNSPPTNRSGTTFALFFFGVIFYYALIMTLWVLVMIGLVQGSIGYDWIGKALTRENPEARAALAQYAPIVAALIIVVASQFRQVLRIDSAARAFCFKLAAIPREADRLTIELAQSADFQPTEKLRDHVTRIISDNISPGALNFSRDGTLAARFTRAVALYNLFVGPRSDVTPLDFATNGYGRSAYARIMQLGEAIARRADARYEELMHTGLAFFTSSQPTRELKEALNRNITDVSNLTCSLIARYVLFSEKTHNNRLKRLADMGFDARPTPTFGPDQWVTTILLVVLLSVGIRVFMPGMRQPLDMGDVLTIAIAFAVSIGFAVLGAIVVAQRFIERHEGDRPTFPPIAELVLAALIVAGLSIAARIGIPLVPALLQGQGFQDVFNQFVQRLPAILTPFVCTLSLGLLCSYLGSLNWAWYRILALGALGNGFALVCAGWLVGRLLDPTVLAQFYLHPEDAVQIIALSTGLTGFMVGAMVLAVFNKSQRLRRDAAARAAKDLPAEIPFHDAPSLVDEPESTLPSRSEAARDLGGYTRASVEALEGRYICFRPAFSADAINAYLVVVRWDEAKSCLRFEEQQRVDSGHTQSGWIYIPDGRECMSLVTLEDGAIRLIMVSLPENEKPARGLIVTLSNPDGAHLSPASAPIVLRRVVDETPQLGFIRPGTPDYEAYRRELDIVIPTFGFFAVAPRGSAGTELLGSSQDIRLAS